MHRFRLPGEGIESVMVEIGRGEGRVPLGGEAPRAIVEALAGDVDIIAVEYAVDEAGSEIRCGEARGGLTNQVEQPQRAFGIVARRLLGIEVFEAVADECLDVLDLAE